MGRTRKKKSIMGKILLGVRKVVPATRIETIPEYIARGGRITIIPPLPTPERVIGEAGYVGEELEFDEVELY